MKKKVYIHQIQSNSWKNLIPLSAALLTSYAESISEISTEYDFEINVLRQNPLQTIQLYTNPEVLAFSTYSWNFKQSLEVARLGKKAVSDVLIVFGGPMMPNNLKDIRVFFDEYPFIDIIVHGMGEWTFKEILLARIDKKDINSIVGISYRNNLGDIITTDPFFNKNLDEIPSPFLNGILDGVMSKYGDRITGVLWETNRGCPYNCSFCVQGEKAFSKIITFNKDRLFKELEWISQKKISYLFCTDANFGILQRDIDISGKIADLKEKNGYPKYFIVNWMKNSSNKTMKILETLTKKNVYTRLTLSMQSFNESTLDAVKRKNIKLSTSEEIKKESAKKGIITYTELILGLPNDTYDSLLFSIDKSLDKCLTHFFVVYLCRLLDGTEMSKNEYINLYKLETRSCRVEIARHEGFDVGVAETEKIVVATSTLPIHDWEKCFDFIYITLVLYNFRLAFFIFNYLRNEYSINLIDLIKYIIQQVTEEDFYPIFNNAMKTINNVRKSILNGEKNLISIDFMKDMLFEVHEAVLLGFINQIDDFYQELYVLVCNFLKNNGFFVKSSILNEVFKYQSIRVPTWKKLSWHHLTFTYNIPQYFQALCIDNNPIAICEQKTEVEIGDKNDKYNDPVDFAKSKINISTFEISKIQFWRT